MGIIVAIDGPAASGKGTVTKNIEKKLGLFNLDTGAVYRCIALEALNRGLNLEDEKEICNIVDEVSIEIKKDNETQKDIILVDGKDVSKEIRTQKVNEIVSPISSIVLLREKVVHLLRKIAEGKELIAEGRDVGTVIFPNADLKIYLDATPEERAKRRYEELKDKEDVTYEEIFESLRRRDENDKNKKVGALKQAEDAIYIDTTGMSIDEATNIIVQKINELKEN